MKVRERSLQVGSPRETVKVSVTAKVISWVRSMDKGKCH